MIHINTEGPIGEKYAQWCEKAERARKGMVAEWKSTGRSPELNQKIWKELKELLLNDVFHQKCAYCEGKISAHVTLDVEHYRPKKQVTEDRVAAHHSGYFWLAYEWYNLFLACRHCNSAHRSYRDGKPCVHPGKANEFPILGERVKLPASDPSAWQSELRKEKPLLLNPYFDKPEEHIGFDENGFAYAKKGSPFGRATIDVCDLNRPELIEARREARSKIDLRMIDFVRRQPDVNFVSQSDAFSAWLWDCVEQVTARFNEVVARRQNAA